MVRDEVILIKIVDELILRPHVSLPYPQNPISPLSPLSLPPACRILRHGRVTAIGLSPPLLPKPVRAGSQVVLPAHAKGR
jgi:hypothetical protein